MDHDYAGILDNGSFLVNPLDGSSVEMGSSNAVYECIERDDGGDIRNAEENHMQIVNAAENGLYVDDGDHGVEGSRLKRKRSRGPRLWREKWQKMHPWAFTRKVDGEERMFCTVCEAHGLTTTRNAFRKEGSTNFQQSALATHANSSAHKTALGTQNARSEAGKMGTNVKACGKTVPTAEHGAVAYNLINIANKISSLVTREDLESLKAELRLITVWRSHQLLLFTHGAYHCLVQYHVEVTSASIIHTCGASHAWLAKEDSRGSKTLTLTKKRGTESPNLKERFFLWVLGSYIMDLNCVQLQRGFIVRMRGVSMQVVL